MARFVGAFLVAMHRRPASRLRPAWLVPVVLGMALAVAASAQSTHYIGTQSIVINTLPGLYESLAVAVDGSGHIFVAHSCIGNPPQCAMWEETPSGGGYTQTTLPDVGNDAGSFDWGANPPVVAVDSEGNIYTNDHYDCYPGGYGCNTGGLASATYLWKLTPSAGSYTASTVTTLSNPGGARGAGGTIYAIAVDGSGNVYWTDAPNGIVWKETLSGGTYSTSVIASVGYPAGVAADSSGNVYVADEGYTDQSTTPPTIYPPAAYKMTPAAGGYNITSIGSGWVTPTAVTVDSSGNVYVADAGGGMSGIFKLTPAAGGYTQSMIPIQGESSLYYGADNGNVHATDLAVDSSGSLYIAAIAPNSQGDEHLLKETSGGGNFGAVNVGSKSSTPLSAVFFRDAGGTGNTPVFGSWKVLTQGAQGMDFTDAGTGSCIVDSGAAAVCTVDVNFTPTQAGTRYGAVEVLDNSGNVMATGYVQGTGVGPRINFLPAVQSTIGSGLSDPNGVAVDGSGNVFVADRTGSNVEEILAAGGYTTVNSLGSGFTTPEGVAVDGSGNVFVADTYNSAVKEIPAAGGYTTINTLGSGFSYPQSVAVDGSGNVIVADRGNNAIKEILAAGGYTTVKTLGSGFSSPYGVTVDGSGNVFVADTDNNAVKEILAAGGYITVNTLGGGFNHPRGVMVNGNGDVFVADTSNNEVKEILAAGGYTTVNALGSGFSLPGGVAVDGSGNVYIADYGNNRVEKLDYADPPSLSFATTQVGQTSSDSPQTVTVSNVGNANLAFSALSYPTDFLEASGVSTDCTASSVLAAGTGCTLSIDFTPQPSSLSGASTPLSESIALTTNSLNATTAQPVGVSGTVTAALASLTSPSAGSVLTGPSENFTWTSVSGATGYKLWIGATAGGNNIYNSGPVTATSATPATLPTNGETVYVRLWTNYNGSYVSSDYTYTAATQAALTSPLGGSVLAGPKVTFNWTTAGGATGYSFRLGTTVGGNNLYGSGPITATSATATNLPTNGETIYATLYTYYGSLQVDSQYTFTAATQAGLTSPLGGSVLAGPKVTFNWTTAAGATGYSFRLGTAVGANNLYGSGPITATSATATGLPTNGETIYATLYTYYGSLQVDTQYTFTAATQAGLMSPLGGSVLTGPKVTFDWTTAAGATGYSFRLGTTVGGNNLYGSGPITATSATAANLPTNGETIYATLYTYYGSLQVDTQYTFTAATQAAITSPAGGSVLTGSTVTFDWTTAAGATGYSFRLGTTVGGNNLYGSGPITATSATATNLPTNGETIYATLYTYYGSLQVDSQYTYTAQ